MSKVIINGEAYEAETGETLLNVARRNGAHIGFVCDGRGFCATCECWVRDGGAALSPRTQLETDWLGPRLQRGYRLSCQTLLEGPETVEVISRPEMLRRQFEAIFAPTAGENTVDNASRFLTNLTQITVDHLLQAPAGLSGTLNRIGPFRLLFPWKNFDRFVNDTDRVVRHQDGEISEGIPPATPTDLEIRDEPTIPTSVQIMNEEIAPPPAPAPAAPLALDDLARIEGIGEKTASVLNAAGIHTFQQLAATPLSRLRQITNEGGLNLANPESWPEQAKLAAAGDWGALQILQDNLKGGRKV